MIATSVNRVSEQTAEPINEQLRQSADIRVAYFAVHPEQIDQRLGELDQEWDIERALEMTSASLSALGLVMGILWRRRWLMLPVVVQGFFLQHAIQGWCPPLEALRRMGFRTQAEIEAERYALKAIRGDFAELSSADEEGDAQERAEMAMRAVRGDDQPRGMGRVSRQQEVGARSNGGNDGGGSKQRGRKGKGKSQHRANDDIGPGSPGVPKPDVGPTS
jgi:hypothetical protein